MGNPHNVELEAAKFLHKLIQDSTDEPTKLATKLYVILQHMRSSGKENSMPYQVISRAMETVISQNNLDIEALMSSRVPLTSGSHVADSASAQSAGAPSKVHGVTTSASGSYPIVESAISSPMQFSSSSYDNHGFVAKMHKDRSVDAFYSTPSVDVFSAKVSLGKALEHDGGISNTLANTTNTVQMSSSTNETLRKDPAWKYSVLVDPQNMSKFRCNFCQKEMNGGVCRVKQHLVGGYRNVTVCKRCPSAVRDEILEYMNKKKQVKEQVNILPDFDDVVELDGDEYEEDEDVIVGMNKKGKKQSVNCSTRGSNSIDSIPSKLKKPRQIGPIDCYFTPNPDDVNRKGKEKQTRIDDNAPYKKELMERAYVRITRWIYDSGIPFNVVNNESFGPMIEAIGQYGPGLKPPSYHQVRVPYLKKEVDHTNKLMKDHINDRVKYGCSIMCDGWTDKRNRSLLNFLVNCPKGTMFVESIDASSYAKDANKMFQLLDNFVEKIGEDNVVQVVTDSAAANVLAGKFLEASRPNLYWTPCAAHCLDLMLEDIFKLPNLKKAFERAISIHGYIYNRLGLLNMMRRFTNFKELVKPAKTRFATAFLTLQRLYSKRNELRTMFTSDEWKNSKWAKEPQGKKTAQILLMPSFWNTVHIALKFACPLVHVLRLVDGEKKPPMGYIYEAMDRAKEVIANSFDENEDKYKDVFEIIDRRWNVQLHRPLHAAGFYLNPEFYYKNPEAAKDKEISTGLFQCISKLVKNVEVQDRICEELTRYEKAEGLFGIPMAVRQRTTRVPAEWWGQYGRETPNLQTFAIRVLSLTCSASGCERNWSVFEHCGVPNHVPEMGMIRNAAPRDTGKSPMSQAPSSSMPFKEQHLKQLRAQCLVFLAFRNGLMPKKLHLEIALGNFFPKEDGPHKELIEHRGKDQSINEVGSGPDMTMPFGRLDNSREIDINPAGQSSTRILAEANLYKEAENLNMMEDKNDQLTCLSERKHRLATKKMEDEVQTRKTAESLAFAMKGPQPDSILRGLAANNQENDLESCHRQIGIASQASPIVSMGKHMKAEVISRTGDGYHNEASKVLPPTSTVPHESVQDRKDNVPVQSQSRGDGNVQRNQHVDGYLSSIPLREHWQPMSGMDGQHHLVRMKNVSQDQEEEDISIPTERPRSPKYTTSEKWILEHQKRKLRTGQNWVLKQQKTEQRIAACSDKLKESVSSSEDISAKTKSVIELKKLQLLELQRRLRSDILNDFFKPIATEMDRLKAIKKHRIGRRSKQVERFEQRMKEERQKRIRERQKEFFSEIEVHRERLEDVFKMKRERWKGFNKYVREFHKRRERIYREKNDRIQREKINLLKINDVEGYLRMVQDAKSDRVKQLLKETEKYLQKLGSKLQDAKVISRQFETDMVENKTTGGVEKNEIAPETEDDTDQAKHYLESNEKYYLMAHSIKEHVAEQPTSLVGGKLREYQMNGLRWLVSLYNNHLNGILADEMGLGKTVQVIALICYLMETKNDRGPFLVVVPSSVLPGWDSEINVWAPSILKIVYSGPPEERRRLFKERIVHQKFNVLLTTYEYLMNKHDRPKLSKVHWHYIIIDEGHRIKNASCKLNADLKHYHSNHRLLLTGTPLQNNLEELWALLNFLLPNIFNSSEDFSQWFNKPFESNGDDSLDEALLSEEENLLIINRLHQVLRPFVLRRLKHKVEHQLPEKIERLVRCEASAYQKLLMRRVEDNLGAIGTSKARTVHNSVMELRNICNHPYLSHIHVEEVHDLIPMHYLPNIIRLCGKLEMLDRLLPKLKATDHRVLLFSTMTRLLDVMEDYLCWKQYRYLRLDGHTSGGDRGALLDKFNQPGSPFFIFLLSIRAGGVGVNLQAADTVIIFDTDWNPQVDLQAQARAHRIGQKRDVLVLRLETVQTVEEQVRAAAEHKLGVANQSITAGFFDNNTSAEDRREYLESLLRESKKEEVAPVLDDDALNDLIARSESEIDIFESVDKHRWEEEMAAWKKLVSGQGTGCSDPVPPLPSRLVTYEDLKPFYEAMKISEVRNPGLVSNAGIKRKSEFGGLDTQQYGRGKRAREVRSYEEHWSEEESEKICKADSPGSPRVKEVIEQTLPTVASGPVMVIGETGELTPPKLPPQPSVELPTQQSKEVTPPSRRGRGRPKRATTEVTPPPMVLPVQPSVNKMDLGSQIGKVSSCPTVPGPDSLPNSTTVNSIGGTIQQFGVFIAPSFQSTPPLFSIPPASQSTAIPGPCMPVQVRGRGRKIQSGVEAPRRRGKKQSTILTTVPVLPAPSGTGNPDFVSQGVAVSSSPLASGPDSVYGSTIATNISKEPVAVSPVLPGFPAPSGTNKVDIGLQRDPVSSSPMGCKPDLRSQGVTVSGSPSASGPDSVSGSTIEKDIIREPLPTSPLFPCIPASTGTDKVDIGLQRGPVSNSPMVSGSSVVTGISGTEHALGVQDVPSSQPTPPLPSVTQCSIPPSHSVPEQVRGRGRKAQSAIEAPRRRGKRQDPVIPVVPPDGLTDLNPKSNEPSQKKSRVSGVKMSITTRSKRENDAQKLINVIQALPCKVPNPDGLAGQDSNLTEQSDNSAQNKQQTSTSAPNNLASLTQDKTGNSENRVDAPTEMKNVNFSAENKASPSRANLPVEQVHAAGTKGAALMINKVSCETSSAEIKNDKSLGSGEDAPTLPVSSNTFIEATENQSLDGKSSLASSTSGTAPVFDFPVEKFEGQFEKEGGGKVEEEKSHVMDEFVAPKPMVCEPDNKRTDQDHCHEKSGDNEAQKLTDFVHVQACQVLSPDGFAGQDTKSAEQLDCSLQNRLETSSLATIDVAVGFPVKNSTDIEVKEVGTPTKSKDGRLSKESEASPNCAYSPTGQIYNADVKDGGAARQEIPCETLLVEAQIGESFGSEGGDAPTLSVSSNSLIEVPVNQSLTDKANFSLSTLEMDPVSNLPSGKCPSLSEKEGGERVENEKHPVLDESVTRKPKVSDLGRKITDGSHCDEKGGENEAEIFNTQACEVFTPAGSAGQDSKSSEQADYSAQSKPETSSAAAIDAIVSFPVGKSAYLEVHAPTKSKDGDLSKEIECSETFRDPSAEQIHTSNLAPTMLEVPYESPLSDSKINECLSSEGGDAQALPLSSNIASEVIMNPPSDNEIYSVLSTTKMDAVCDPLIDQSESQSGKEGAQKIEEENNIGRDRSGSSKPKVFTLESETETVACVTDIAHSKRLIDESFGSAGGSSPNGHISSGNLVEVTEDQSPEGINEKSGKVVAEEEENVERVLDKVAVSEPEIIQSSMGNLISSVEAAATPPLDFPVDNKSVDQSEKADIK